MGAIKNLNLIVNVSNTFSDSSQKSEEEWINGTELLSCNGKLAVNSDENDLEYINLESFFPYYIATTKSLNMESMFNLRKLGNFLLFIEVSL